jgi:16S rRNA (uracil1498-N3)-methyltransferase
MHRFYLPPEQCQGDIVILTEREAHHAVHVLRLRTGDSATVLDGAGRVLSCVVESQARKEVRLKVTEKTFVPERPQRITLLQAIPKAKLLDSIIQKATELGVSRIVPLLSERVVIHLEDKQAKNKTDKWQAIAIEAIKQCGQPWLPRVEAPATPEQFLKRAEQFELPLVASLESGSKHLRNYFAAFSRAHDRLPSSICIWVGPEGDFTPQEYAIIRSSGALPITLGPLVLRVETAATYCLSVLNYELEAGEALR